jgi:hypothetical protein
MTCTILVRGHRTRVSHAQAEGFAVAARRYGWFAGHNLPRTPRALRNACEQAERERRRRNRRRPS